MITLNEIRQRLIKEIRNSNKSISKIANEIGIKQPTLSQYLNGRAMPALDTFANLCVVLDVDPADILGTNKPTETGNKTTTIKNSFNGNTGNINFKA